VILRESISLRIFLHNLNQPLPGGSTIDENLNALSNTTRERIHKAQLALALDEGLDDFASLRIDSTHCASASAYPTDSGTLTKLVYRLCARMQNLKPIDLPVLASDQLEMLEEARKETQVLNYRICTLTSSSALQAEQAAQEERERFRGEQGANEGEAESPQIPEKQAPDANEEARKESPKTKLRRELYQELYARSLVTVEMLVPMLDQVTEQMSQSRSNPQIQERRDAWLAAAEADLQAVAAAIEQSQRRVCEGKKPGAKSGMPLSVSDCSASFIEKGGWQRAFGYRPQCGFSGKGLITALVTPEGNVSDQIQLSPLVNKSIENTTVIPGTVTVDDGYTGASELANVKEAGVEVVSFSGARGRVLLGEETWEDERYVEARRDRNGAESGIFVLKEKVGFGQLSRTGIEAVRAEQLEKVLTVNTLKIVELRKRRYKKEHRASWSQGMVGKGKREVA
jgi:IS5 family transposase